MPEIRLQKFLSQAGVCSRRQGEEYIVSGHVRVNGRTVTELGTKIDPDRDQVTFRGKPVIAADKLIYIALNKPSGYVTSCDQPGDKTVMQLVDIPARVYPVGRLDKDSAGLLLLTNDGRLHHRLSHPSFDHEKEYEVTTAGPVPDSALARMAKGMNIMGAKTRAAEVRRISPASFRIILKEGKNRQIRRMVEKVGNHVRTLKRIRISNIQLARLPEGTWRYLTEKEKEHLLSGLTE